MIKCEFEDGNIAKPGLRHLTTGVLVLREGKILMGKRAAGLLEAGKWGLIGGFMERNETIEACARREVYEETGWEMGDLTLLRINDNPDRPHEDRENVDFIYFGEAIRQTGRPDDETEEMEWYELDALPDREMIAFDHAEDIDVYRDHLHKRFALPVLYNRS